MTSDQGDRSGELALPAIRTEGEVGVQNILTRGRWRHVARGAAACLLSVAVAAPLAGPALAQASLCSEANVNAYLNTGQRQTRIDKAKFYSEIRDDFSIYRNEGDHYRGTDAILNYWNAHAELKDSRWLAYILATAYHETARKMFPVRETLASSDAQAISRLSSHSCCRNSTYWHVVQETGKSYFGRGYVQLTWATNYKRADQRFSIDTNNDRPSSYYWTPDLALQPDSSIRITYDGMIYGWFTGHCLLRHFHPDREAAWKDARRIINGTDKAAKIAGEAQTFLTALRAAEVPASFDEVKEQQDKVIEEAIENSDLGEENEELNEENQQLEDQVSDLAQQLEELRDQLSGEQTKFEALAASNRGIAEVLTTFQGELTGLKTAISGLDDELGSLRQTIAAAPEPPPPPPLQLSPQDRARLDAAAASTEEIQALRNDRQADRELVELLLQESRRTNQNLQALVQALEQESDRTFFNYVFGD